MKKYFKSYKNLHFSLKMHQPNTRFRENSHSSIEVKDCSKFELVGEFGGGGSANFLFILISFIVANFLGYRVAWL